MPEPLPDPDAFEHMSDAFVAFDEGWCYTYVNGPAERLLGRSRADLVGRTIWDLYPEARDTPVESEYREAVRTGRPRRFEVYYPPHARWYENRTFPAGGGLAV